MPPINQKRLVAFLNTFVVSTVNFLNKFVVNCETKFIDFETKLQKLEASLVILEAKLSTIPTIEETPNSAEQIHDNKPTTSNDNNTPAGITSIDTIDTNSSSNQESKTIAAQDSENNNSNATSTPVVVGVKACEDIRFKKYFKMVQFGVPAPAVKSKMEAEGIDSSLLE